ncbi:hypothetical protein CY35_11G038600, partial [Sphagnum magellanicum]
MKINRPLSPHLTIYKPQLISTFSISHRIFGAFLGVAISVVNFILLVLCYHMSNGIRHLLWDLGLFLELSK